MFEMQAEKSQHNLNASVRGVRNHHLSFHVHYWGIDLSHFDNLAHKHSFFEICYVVSGCGTYVDDGVELQLQENVLFLSRPGVIHQIRSGTGLEILFVAFDIDQALSTHEWNHRFQRLRETENVLLQNVENTLTMTVWQTLIHSACSATCPPDIWYGLALTLLATFPDAFTISPVHQNAGKATRIKATNPIVERAVLFIRDNLTNSITLQKISAYLSISSRHFSRIFKQSTGMSYNEFVQNERIAYARQLLTETDYPLKEVAEMTGFSSIHYFTNVFTRLSKQTPATYRRLHRVGTEV